MSIERSIIKKDSHKELQEFSFIIKRVKIARKSYQLDLVMPGIIPWEASSLNDKRESLNLRKYPLARPVNWQRFLRRVGDVSLGILLSAMRAFSLSSSERFMLYDLSRKSFRLFQWSWTSFSRRFCFSTDDFFAMLTSLFFSRWSFLTLLAVRVFFVNDVQPPSAMY